MECMVCCSRTSCGLSKLSRLSSHHVVPGSRLTLRGDPAPRMSRSRRCSQRKSPAADSPPILNLSSRNEDAIGIGQGRAGAPDYTASRSRGGDRDSPSRRPSPPIREACGANYVARWLISNMSTPQQRPVPKLDFKLSSSQHTGSASKLQTGFFTMHFAGL